jgi:hypothetical protein
VRPGQTLQATALVHEAYLRLIGAEVEQHWDHRGHFFAAPAQGRFLTYACATSFLPLRALNRETGHAIEIGPRTA